MNNGHRRDSTITISLDVPYEKVVSLDKVVAFDRPRTLIVAFVPKKPILPLIPDFPDGGRQAWSVVIGVSTTITSYSRSDGHQALLISLAT